MLNQVYMCPLPFVQTADFTVKLCKSIFVGRGDSLHAWARRNGFSPTHVLRSIRADYHGPKARKVVDLLKLELGV